MMTMLSVVVINAIEIHILGKSSGPSRQDITDAHLTEESVVNKRLIKLQLVIGETGVDSTSGLQCLYLKI